MYKPRAARVLGD